MLQALKKIIPPTLQARLLPVYHYLLALSGALIYRFPSRKIKVVAITGTKGKTSTAEIVNAILEEAGFKTALAGTLRFKIGSESIRNTYKMTMIGRFFLQHFLRKAVKAGCEWAVVEMTSEGARQFRHKFIDLDALIFTNLSPEHIESHGSYENYVQAKLSIGRALKESHKSRPVLVINADDKESEKFIALGVKETYSFSKEDALPYQERDTGIFFTLGKTAIQSYLHGEFNLYNMLGSITFARTQGIPMQTIKHALEHLREIPGRRQVLIQEPFEVVVDYAHTIDSLEQLYKSFKGKILIGVLGNTGGGRDTWKRPGMALVADSYCDHIILTNEDPYDENPNTIVNAMAKGMQKHIPQIILDRRMAIQNAFKKALETREENPDKKVAVLITGKGTDPYIMGPDGSKMPWDDANVAFEELRRLEIMSSQ
ncbi:MAG: hypothetical protein RJA61_505 [Candidatus Parcubacteria bacterium]|jgi:UDP-N-acetylmuramoyl-L-alanyl-D-glutamate--2,6-diaminopimelate ligase